MEEMLASLISADKGTIILSLRSPVVDGERMRPVADFP